MVVKDKSYAKCDYCNLEMRPGTGCTFTHVDFNGKDVARIRMDEIDSDGEARNCHDCNAGPGQLHHPGCDWERCPVCGGQIISCSCFNSHMGFVIYDSQKV